MHFPAKLNLHGGSTPLFFLNRRFACLTVVAEGVPFPPRGEFLGVGLGDVVSPATACLKLSCLYLQSFADLGHFFSKNFKHSPSFRAFSFFSFDIVDLSGVEFLEPLFELGLLGLEPGFSFEGLRPRPLPLAFPFVSRPLSLG